MAVGTDAVAEAEKLCREIIAELPVITFVGGKWCSRASAGSSVSFTTRRRWPSRSGQGHLSLAAGGGLTARN
jgi:hypothetical protein